MRNERLEQLQQIGIGMAYLAVNGKVIVEHHRVSNKAYKRGFYIFFKKDYNVLEAHSESLLDAINDIIEQIEDWQNDK